MENKHYMYVLECRDNSFYTGYTNNVEKRLQAHNSGKGAKYTRAKGPVTLFFCQEYENKSEALKAEYQFKQLSRKKKEAYIEESRDKNVATKEFSKE